MAHRNPGEGSVCKRPNGTWQASLQVNGVRKVLYAKTEKEAKKKLGELQKQVAVTNSIPTPGRRTVQDLINEWLATVGPSLKPRTLAGYEWYMKQYVTPTLGTLALSKLTPTHLQRLYTSFQDKGLTRTAAIVHARLHSAFNLAVLWNWLPNNPTERTLAPKHQYKRKEVWDKEELARFLEATEGHWLRPLWIVAIGTGCRLGELLALRWTDIDMPGKLLSVHRSIQRINRQWIETTPKTRAGDRLIALPQEAVEALRKQKILVAERRLQAGPDWQDRGLVFTAENGAPLHPSVAQHTIRHTCHEIGIKAASPHQLRHLHASLLLKSGLPITAVSQRLGHANAAITMSVYAHALKKQDDEAAIAIQTVLEKR